MATPSERVVLKRLFTHCDRLAAIESERGEMTRPAVKLREASRAEMKRALAELSSDSQLGALVRRYRLDLDQLTILLALVRQRLTANDPHLPGRRLLGLLSGSSYDLLGATSLLDEQGVLATAGLIMCDASSEERDVDPLESRFRVSERVVRTLRAALAERGRPNRPAPTRVTPYRSNLAYLMDLRGLSLLCRARAAIVFKLDYFSDVGSFAPRTLTSVKRRIATATDRVSARLDATTRSADFALVSATSEFGLRFDELVVLVTMLFQELREGAAFLDCVDILKLVSESEEDLVRRRRFLSKRSPLIRHNLLTIEEIVADKELTGEAYLPNWVIDRLLGDDERPVIDADSKLDFHDYLERLDSSDDFFDDLGAVE